MDNSLENTLLQANQLLKISLTQYKKIAEALNSTSDVVEFEIELPNGGNKQIIKLPSMTQLSRRMDNFENNIDQLTTLGNGSTYAELKDKYGQIRQLFAIDYENKPSIIEPKNVKVNNNIAYIDNVNNVLNNIYSHNVVIDYNIDNIQDNADEIRVSKITINPDFMETVKSGYNGVDRKGLIEFLDNSNIEYKDVETIQHITPSETRFFGGFDVLRIISNDNGTITLKLVNLAYNDRDSNVLNSKELSTGVKLINESGKSIFEVVSVNNLDNTVIVKRTLGTDSILNGSQKIKILDDDVRKSIKIDMSTKEIGYIFFAQIHKHYNTTTGYSDKIEFDTNNYSIEYNNRLLTLNEYFDIVNEVNIGEWLLNQATDSTPPSNYAIIPDKPIVTGETFKVVQINKHLIESTDIKQVKTLMQSKNKIETVLTKQTNDLRIVQSRISTGNYKSITEKKNLETKRNKTLQLRDKQNRSFSAVVRQLKTVRDGSSVKNVAPKYRVRGFWNIPEPKTSNNTKPQEIVGYNVRYRYVSTNDNLSQPQQFNLPLTNEGSESQNKSNDTTATFSTWKTLDTVKRKKIIVDGKRIWETQDVSSSEQININQLDIPIQVGERVQFRIQAISEIGQPNIEVVSPWSDILTVEFPEDLSNVPTLESIDDEINNNLRQVEIDEILESKGVLKHIQDSFTENNNYYAHTTKQIASGFFTEERNNIALFDELLSIKEKLTKVNDVVFNINNDVSVSVIDSDGNNYSVINNGIINLDAGYYVDEIGEDGLGAIVSKQFYIKIENTNVTPIQLFSMVGNDLTAQITNTNALSYYNAPIGFINSPISSLPTGIRQYEGQVLYNRYNNVADTRNLYRTTDFSANPTTVQVPTTVIASGTSGENIYHKPTSTTVANVNVTLSPPTAPTTDFLAVHEDHPLAGGNGGTPNLSAINNLLTTYSNSWSPLLKDESAIEGLQPDGTNRTGFDVNDQYLVGSHSCGAHFFLNPINTEQIQVDSSRLDSYKTIKQGEGNALIIPLMFQYRMQDRMGNIDGKFLNADAKPKYTKTMGFDLKLLGKTFRFDVKATASYRGSVLDSNNLPAVSLGTAYAPIF